MGPAIEEEWDVWLRVLFGIFLIGHGMGHVTWFLAAYVPSSLGDQARRLPLFGSGPAAAGFLGRVLGIVGLAVLAGFVLVGAGFFQRAEWWEPAAIGVAAASVVLALLWWNPVGAVSIPALLADVAIVLVILLPIGEKITEAA